jgi:hypothetical protein
MRSTQIYDRLEDALDETIRACGGRKAVSAEMWKDKSARDAHNLIDACLNPDRRERFTPGQVVYLTRLGAANNCHAIMQYLALECGYDVKPISRADKVDQWTSVIEQSTKALAAATAALERLQELR